MKQNEVVLKVGGEGGRVALYGLRSHDSWLFSLDFINAHTASTGESPSDGPKDVVTSWSEALALLDRYPWHALLPTLVHPEFRADVLDAVRTRCISSDGTQKPVPEQWMTLCSASTSADLSPYQTSGPVHSSDAWLYNEVDDRNTDEEREYLRKEMLKLGLTEDDVKDMF